MPLLMNVIVVFKPSVDGGLRFVVSFILTLWNCKGGRSDTEVGRERRERKG